MSFFTERPKAFSRDLLVLAERDNDKYEREQAHDLRAAFINVFGYHPQLGEPNKHGDKRSYFIQGYLFRTIEGKLFALTTRDTWLHISRPRDLLGYDDELSKEEYDRF